MKHGSTHARSIQTTSSQDQRRSGRLIAIAAAAIVLAVLGSTIAAAPMAAEEAPAVSAVHEMPGQIAAPMEVAGPGPLGRRLLRLPFLPVDARIVFVLDGSNSLEGRLNVEMKKSARRTLRLLRVRHHPDLEVGVVQFDKRARIGCRLTHDERRLFGCINQVRHRLGSNVVDALREAYKMLVGAREHPGVAADKPEIIVLYSDGLARNRADDVRAEAHSIKANNIRVISVAVGPRANTELLADVATTPHDLYLVASHVRLGD